MDQIYSKIVCWMLFPPPFTVTRVLCFFVLQIGEINVSVKTFIQKECYLSVSPVETHSFQSFTPQLHLMFIKCALLMFLFYFFILMSEWRLGGLIVRDCPSCVVPTSSRPSSTASAP